MFALFNMKLQHYAAKSTVNEVLNNKLSLPTLNEECTEVINDYLTIYTNHLEKIFELFPDKPWNFAALSGNRSLPSHIPFKYPHKPWDWKKLQCILTKEQLEDLHIPLCSYVIYNPNVSVDFIANYFINSTHDCNMAGIFFQLSCRASMSDVLKYHYMKWDWLILSKTKKNISFQDVIDHPHFPWHWKLVSAKPMTIPQLVYALDIGLRKKLSWRSISRFAECTIQEIIDNKNIPWDMQGVSFRKDFETRLLSMYPVSKFNWAGLSGVVSMEFIIHNPHFPWNWPCISQRSDLDYYICNYPDKPWDWKRIDVSSLSASTIEQNTHIPRINIMLSRLSFPPSYIPTGYSYDSYIERNITENAILYADIRAIDVTNIPSSILSRCRGLSTDIVRKNSNKLWDWHVMSSNTFSMDGLRKKYEIDINDKLKVS